MATNRLGGRRTAALACTFALITAAGAGAQLGLAGAAMLQQGVGGFPDESEFWDELGWAVASGDFDGDGRDDLAIGALTETPAFSAFAAGQVTVVYGAAGGIDPSSGTVWALDWTGFGPAQDLDLLGSSVASGDFDQDGYDDLAIGIPFRDVAFGGGTVDDAGAVLVLYGGPGGIALGGQQLWHQGANSVAGVPEDSDWFGAALAAGDFNSDGFADLAISVYGEDVGAISGAGAVNVIYGSPSGLSPTFAPIDDQIWTQGDLGLTPDEAGDSFGRSLAAGDFDGDGIDDLAVGAPGEDVGAIAGAGAVTAIYGTGLGLAATGAQIFTQNDLIPGSAEPGDLFGSALAVGDFGGDGYDDLAIGSPWEDAEAGFVIPRVGAVHLVSGEPGGLNPLAFSFLDRSDVDGTVAAEDQFGASLAAGDFDGDGRDDLVVGAPGVDVSGIDEAGAAFVFAGQDDAEPLYDLTLSQAGSVPGAPEVDDHFAASLATGDFDGNGFDELAVGVPEESAGGAEDAGVVNLFADQGLFRDGFEVGSASRWSAAVSN